MWVCGLVYSGSEGKQTALYIRAFNSGSLSRSALNVFTSRTATSCCFVWDLFLEDRIAKTASIYHGVNKHTLRLESASPELKVIPLLGFITKYLQRRSAVHHAVIFFPPFNQPRLLDWSDKPNSLSRHHHPCNISRVYYHEHDLTDFNDRQLCTAFS